MKMNVLVDMDNVLVDFFGGIAAMVNQEGCYRWPAPEQLNNYWITQTFVELYGAGAFEYLQQIYRRPGFYRSLRPADGALEVWPALTERYNVWICSTPDGGNSTCASDKLAWVAEHLGEEWAGRTILTVDKTLVRGHFLIDDRPEIRGALMPTWKHILFNNGCAYCQPQLGQNSVTWSSAISVLQRLDTLRLTVNT